MIRERTIAWSDPKLTAEAGRSYTSLEIKVNYVRAVTDESGELTAEGTLIYGGRGSAVAEGKVLNASGRLCATASTTRLVFELPAA